MPSETTPTKNTKKTRPQVVADSHLLKATHRERLPDQEEPGQFRPFPQQNGCPKSFPQTDNLGFESKLEMNLQEPENIRGNELHGPDQLAPHGLEELESHGPDQLAPHGFESLNPLKPKKSKHQKLEGFLQD